VNGLKVTTVDVSGTYTAQMSPAATSISTAATIACGPQLSKRQGQLFRETDWAGKDRGALEQSFVDYVKSFEFK